MLHKGCWYPLVPKEYEANLHFRARLLAMASGSRENQQALIRACADDLLFYVNAFVYQFNPRKKGKEPKVGPFITWDFQDPALLTMLEHIEDDRDLVIEKSREMGASWMMLLAFEWLWHFHPWNKFLMISRNEKAVDDEDPDSLFWKIDFMHRHQPEWLLPDQMRRRKLFFGNDSLECTFTGQASTGKAGVGGRATAMGIDEFSQILEDREVLHRTSDTTGSRIFNGTHMGINTAFFELCDPKSVAGGFIDKLQLHWTQHPEKRRGLYRMDLEKGQIDYLDPSYEHLPAYEFVTDGTPAGGPHPGLRSPWYDEQCKRKGDLRAVAMDLDIDPQGSVSQFFNPLMIKDLVARYASSPYWEGEILYDLDAGRPKGLVARKGGCLKLWLRLNDQQEPPPSRYGLGADISAGAGATPSVISGIDFRTGEKVLQYTNSRILPEALAPLMTALGWLFKDEEGNGAQMVWEIPGPGMTMGKRIVEIGYERIYYRQSNPVLDNGKFSDMPGWYCNNTTKPLALREYMAALTLRKFLNRDKDSLEDCLNFEFDKSGNLVHGEEKSTKDPTGARVNHGDHVIADALAWMLCQRADMMNRRLEKANDEIKAGSLAWRRDLWKKKNQEYQWA